MGGEEGLVDKAKIMSPPFGAHVNGIVKPDDVEAIPEKHIEFSVPSLNGDSTLVE